jgi:hypothetical protein
MTKPRREPPIDEILSEPVIRLLMTSDGVDDAKLRRLLVDIDRRRRAAPASHRGT